MKPRYVFVTAVACLIGASANAQEYCREYIQDVYVGGVRQSGYGTACMQPDGAWQTANYVPPYPSPQVITTTNYVTPVLQPTYFAPRPYYPTSVFSLSFNSGRSHYYKPRYHHRKHHYRGNGHHRGRGRDWH